MEKTTGNRCPRCNRYALNIYYPDGSDIKVGAWCEACDFKGFYLGDKLVPIPRDVELSARAVGEILVSTRK